MKEFRFIADHMLGKLARWLRLMGYDVLYPSPAMCDDDIAWLADKEHRILLTRDRVLAGRARGAILVESDMLEEQLAELKNRIGLSVELELSRCSVCNAPIELVDHGFARNKVPEKILIAFDEFWYCRRCRKFYWYGSHVENMQLRIRNANRD